ncbi:uncharacterized protein YaaR (DUF327 family) [Paenibacillus sp. PastF-3]|uniref:hypothetical protein n=1 Tax=Paenibacillus sp. PastF-3 TaxID=2940626 RepID=UPI002476D508|nr:hypothetical protein [Paenibacillus sp. PastF-3]MDH6373534.1 uncharacterized protein YaaR (DUF327 family) [Paenibacillus sp. PastF-3]
MTVQNKLKKEPSELEALVKEKVTLASKLGLMGEGAQPIEGYEETEEYKRINEIDLRLWELVK